MRKQRCAKIVTVLLLLLSMLISLTVSVSAYTDEYGNEYQKQYYDSPAGNYRLVVTKQWIRDQWDIIALSVNTTADGTIISAINKHIQGEIGVYWGPDEKYVAVDTPQDPNHWGTVTVMSAAAENSYVYRPGSTQTNYEWLRQHSTSDLPPVEEITVPAALIEGWQSPTSLSIITEYALDNERIFTRRVFDAEQMQMLSQEWGDALNLDDPKNPIFIRASAHSSPDYNRQFSIDTPDGKYRITAETAYLCSDSETWNDMYESISYSENGVLRAEFELDTMHAGRTEGTLYYDRLFWNHLSLKISPDSRYLIAESADIGAYPFYIDLQTRKAAILPSAAVRLDAIDSGNVRVYTEAFSVFGDALVIVCEEDGTRSREVIDLETGEIELSQNAVSEHPAYSYTEHQTAASLKDSITGFISVAQTHAKGVDGLFRLDDDYYYLHMEEGETEYSAKSYREYVCPISVIDDNLDGYRVLYTREGCFVLDENDVVVYAGTGMIQSDGNFLRAVNLYMINPIDSIVTGYTVFDRQFRPMFSVGNNPLVLAILSYL